jgi:tRNA pseudouridine55 synthase
MFGILNIDKPKGYTSHDVVAKLRKILKIKQIGHTGTLDPMATGVLPVVIGKATKLIQYLDDTKAYRAYIKLGVETDTCDLEGKIIRENDVKDINEARINECIETFKGEIEQTPPMFSAVHYQGKRLYEYARKNIEIADIPKRKVFINSIKLLEITSTRHAELVSASHNFEIPKQVRDDINQPVIVLDIECSSGTYIRSIARDLGKMLHCGATLCGLVRTRAGCFKISESYSIEKIEEYEKNGNITKILINPVEVLNLEIINVDDEQIENIKNGKYLNYQNFNLAQNQKVQLVHRSNIVAIAAYEGQCPFENFADSITKEPLMPTGKLYPKTVFI